MTASQRRDDPADAWAGAMRIRPGATLRHPCAGPSTTSANLHGNCSVPFRLRTLAEWLNVPINGVTVDDLLARASSGDLAAVDELVEMGHREQAAGITRALAEAGDSSAWHLLGDILDDMGSGEEAEAAYRMAISTDPEHTAARINLANILKRSGRLEEAETLCPDAISRGDIDANYTLGQVLVLQHRLPAAEVAYVAAAATGDASAMYNLGNLCERLNRLDEAEEWFRRSLIATDLTTNHCRLASVLAQLGRSEEAVSVLRAGIAAGESAAWTDLGILLRTGGEVDAAIAVFEEALASGDDDVLIPYANMMGDDRNDLAAAEALYRRAIASGDAFGHNNLAGLYTEQGRLDEAEAQYRLGAAANDDLAAKNYGLFLVEVGRPAEGRAMLEQAIAMGSATAAEELHLLDSDVDVSTRSDG
jgi:tetratricopeptide (TPR) repeat protein